MQFDPNNKIVRWCAEGMTIEATQGSEQAKAIFLRAWNEAETDFEKFTAAHYVARHQPTTREKLTWDLAALKFALKVNHKTIAESYPSLYLNIAKCYEDLNDYKNANKNYHLAHSFAKNLPANGYLQMIKSGIENGMARVAEKERHHRGNQ